jgi:N-acetylmuramoyl-L-alanine amidase
MSKKIYTSPSSQPENTYAVGNTNEQEQCRKIGAALDKALDRCGFDSKVGLTGTMYTRVAESNAWGSDLHMPLHTNGYNGTVAGLRILVYKKGGEAEQIAKAIMDTLAPITPGKSDGISEYPGLYEIKNSNAICVYIEVGFHDNPEEAQWIIDHTQDIAEAICKGLCNHYGVEYIPANAEPQPEVKPAEKTIYRVQVGAFHNRSNAEALREELKEKGYTDAFITE